MKKKILFDPMKEWAKKFAEQANKCESALDKMFLIKCWCQGYCITAEDAQEEVDNILINAVAR